LANPGFDAPHRRIAFPLDYPSLVDAREGAAKVRGHVGILKVGLQLFLQEGPPALAIADSMDADLFADLKLHDIPETVERAIAAVAASNARYVTVHASGGSAMLSRAAERAERASGGRLVVLAVTVLTSLDDADLAAQGISDGARSQALRLARMAWRAGVRGFVCSPAEVEILRNELGPDALLVTPGVRFEGGDKNDQKRVATPAEAVARGADILVVGRPLRDAADPAAAARTIAIEIAKGLSLRAGTALKGTPSGT
jgi:orotidine-5'-phosphate decarboxylase